MLHISVEICELKLKTESCFHKVDYLGLSPVFQVETLSREDLASRLTLTVNAASVGSLLLSDSLITIMDVC